MSWPTCDSSSKLLGWELRCILPRGHLLDGEQMHRNVDGCEWIITSVAEDGKETRL